MKQITQAGRNSAFETGMAFAPFAVRNPYTGEMIAEIQPTPETQLEAWLNRGHRATLPEDALARVFQNAITTIDRERQDLAALISLESGLCLKDTLREIGRVIETLHAGITLLHTPRPTTFQHFPGGRLSIITEPCPLALAITPFNHPVGQVAHKLVPALAAGSRVLLKPCERTPLSARRFVEILFDAGLPRDRVMLLLTAAADQCIQRILTRFDIDVLSFTGGYEAGARIARNVAALRPMVRQVYELGGSSPLVIADDADLGLAVDVALEIFRNSGQRCTTARKVLLFPRIAPAFTEAFVEATRRLRTGAPLDRQTDVGTLITEHAAQRVHDRVEAALAMGARLLHGHVRERAQYVPTIVDHVPRDAALVRLETFGPVAPLMTINSLDEACDIVRDNGYRLAAAIVTRDEALANAFADRAGVGQFNMNAAPGFRLESAPFGGFGWSGNGVKEGVCMAVEAYRRTRTFYLHDASARRAPDATD